MLKSTSNKNNSTSYQNVINKAYLKASEQANCTNNATYHTCNSLTNNTCSSACTTNTSVIDSAIIDTNSCKATVKAHLNFSKSAKVPLTSFLKNMAANNQTTNSNTTANSNINNSSNSVTNSTNTTSSTTSNSNFTNGTSTSMSANTELRIIIIDENWSQYCYRIKINTPFGKLINRFCQQVRKIDHKSVLFWYHGRLVEDEDTPRTLNIKDGEVILAHYIK